MYVCIYNMYVCMYVCMYVMYVMFVMYVYIVLTEIITISMGSYYNILFIFLYIVITTYLVSPVPEPVKQTDHL